MRGFEYANPETREQAVALLTESGVEAVALAGGTDLLSLLKDDLVAATRLVNLKSIRSMSGIEEVEGGLRLGALTTLDELVSDERVRSSYPALVQAADGVRSPQLQVMGTLGGELLQRPRCWYFRAGFGLLAQREGRSMVLEGDSRYHAILGNDGPAYFVHASSLAPALLALGARARIFGPAGEREEPLAKLWRTPVRESESEQGLAVGEILTDVLVPPSTGASATYEVRPRRGLDWPLAAASVSFALEDGIVRSARVVLGHVAPIPWVATAAARTVVGKPVEEAAAAAGEAAVEGARPLRDNAYKVQLARVAARRAFLRAAGREVPL